MRIRKHAKISPLLYATSSLQPRTVVQTHVCQLNQSPWDVMNFSPPSAPPPPPPSPPPFKVNNYDYSETKSCSRDSISVVEDESEEFVDEYSWRKLEYSDGGSATGDKAEEEEGHVIYCCKTDGKMWRCKRKASPGHAMCEHHRTMMRNYTNNSAPKKQAASVEVAKCRPRPKKASAPSSSSNPYEFYYYSGFGPRWGKKRGQVNTNNGCDDMPKDLEHEHEKEPATMSQFVDDDFEYSEDEDKGNEHGKKRPRKPIKARSLKSLM